MVTILKAVSNSINERRVLVKQFVILTDQKIQKQKELDDPSNNSSWDAKKRLNDQIYNMGYNIHEIKKEINDKYNQNIIKQLKRIEEEQ